MELLGTVVLPVAICLTYSLIINYIISPPNNFADAIPLILLFAVLGLPAILILITTGKIIYMLWLMIYIAALPIWVSSATRVFASANVEVEFRPSGLCFLAL
jgi:chitin synthase